MALARRMEFEAQLLTRYRHDLPILWAQRQAILKGRRMRPEFGGIERRIDELNQRLRRFGATEGELIRCWPRESHER